jgi:hypothetical protein
VREPGDLAHAHLLVCPQRGGVVAPDEQHLDAGPALGGAAVPRTRGEKAAEPGRGSAGLVVKTRRTIVRGPLATPCRSAARCHTGPLIL